MFGPLGVEFALGPWPEYLYLKLMPLGVSCHVFPDLGVSPFCFYFLFIVEAPRCVFDLLLVVYNQLYW